MNQADDATLAFYDGIAKQRKGLQGEPKASTDLLVFMNLLPIGGHVLDLGCGMGQSALAMMNFGLKVKATDASQGMAKMARAIGVDAWNASFSDLDEIEIYDGIWCNFALLHAWRDDVPRHLEAIKTALKPRGILHLSLIEGTGEERDHFGRMYTYFDADDLQNMLSNAGFTITHFERGQKQGMENATHPIITIRAHA